MEIYPLRTLQKCMPRESIFVKYELLFLVLYDPTRAAMIVTGNRKKQKEMVAVIRL
jgi:hypothetical protein